MSGKRLGNFRSGDRSEYLALFALSRFAFVSSIPRQEDFGVPDFLCVLGKEDRHLVFARNAFYVQVKSAAEELAFADAGLTWITDHMDLPLIVCVVDKIGGRIRLYSTWNMWRALFEPDEHVIRLVLQFDTPMPIGAPRFSDGIAYVPVGRPIVDATIDEVEQDGVRFFSVLEKWIELDKQNIASRTIGRIFVRGFFNWEPNISPLEPRRTAYFFDSYGTWKCAEEAIVPVLTALAHNYRHNRLKAQLEAVTLMLRQLRPYLDSHGSEFAEGKLVIEGD